MNDRNVPIKLNDSTNILQFTPNKTNGDNIPSTHQSNLAGFQLNKNIIEDNEHIDTISSYINSRNLNAQDNDLSFQASKDDICTTSNGPRLRIPQVTAPDDAVWRRPNRQLCYLCSIEGIGLRYCSDCYKYYHDSCIQKMEIYHGVNHNIKFGNNAIPKFDIHDATQSNNSNNNIIHNNNNNNTTPVTDITIPSLPALNTIDQSTSDDQSQSGIDQKSLHWSCPWHRCFTCHTELNHKLHTTATPAYTCISCPRSFWYEHAMKELLMNVTCTD